MRIQAICKSAAVLLGALGVCMVAPNAQAQSNDPMGQFLQTQAFRLHTDEPIARSVSVAYTTGNDTDAIAELLFDKAEQETQIALDTKAALDSKAAPNAKTGSYDPLGNLIDNGNILTADNKRQMVADAAFNYLNSPYKWGGSNAATGFDCSGLVRALYLQTADRSLPRTTAAQASATTTIKRSQLEPGDLVFFNTSRRRTFSHVGIYVGNNKFIHAPSSGSQVRIEDMGNRYWSTRFTGARRVSIE